MEIVLGFVFGALVPTLLLIWEWRREEGNELRALRLSLEFLCDEINQNYENRMPQMVNEMTARNIAPSYTLSATIRDNIWRDILRSEIFANHRELARKLNDLYYEIEHINYKVRYLRDILWTSSSQFIQSAIQGTCGLIKKNLEDPKKSECIKGLQQLIDLLPK